jgi:hypothetical protein
MTDDQRDIRLCYALCEFRPDAVAKGAFDSVRQQVWRSCSHQEIDDVLTAIAWALGQPDLDFHSLLPSLPKDRALVVTFLEIIQRDLREIRALPELPMSEERRDAILFHVVYDLVRWPNTVANGGFHEVHEEQWRRCTNPSIDDRLTVIAWALAQPAFDFNALDPALPEDRALVMAYLEIAQRELREIRTLPEPSLAERRRDALLFHVLYDSLRWRDIVANGWFPDHHRERWRRRSNELIDEALAVIAWVLAQPAFDFFAFDPIFPEDRAVTVTYLQIARRELHEIRRWPEPPSP